MLYYIYITYESNMSGFSFYFIGVLHFSWSPTFQMGLVLFSGYDKWLHCSVQIPPAPRMAEVVYQWAECKCATDRPFKSCMIWKKRVRTKDKIGKVTHYVYSWCIWLQW